MNGSPARKQAQTGPSRWSPSVIVAPPPPPAASWLGRDVKQSRKPPRRRQVRSRGEQALAMVERRVALAHLQLAGPSLPELRSSGARCPPRPVGERAPFVSRRDKDS